MTFIIQIHLPLNIACKGEGNITPLQYSCLENPMDGGAWKAAVHGVAKSRVRQSDFTFTFHFYALEKEMATHSSVLAWRIPGTGEPGGLPSMGSHRVGHDWSDLAAAAALPENRWLNFRRPRFIWWQIMNIKHSLTVSCFSMQYLKFQLASFLTVLALIQVTFQSSSVT